VADVLEEMAPDEQPTCWLNSRRTQPRTPQLDGGRRGEDVRKLLTYPDNSAGGIMTTEFFAVGPNSRRNRSLPFCANLPSEAHNIFYIYVTDSEQHLVVHSHLKTWCWPRRTRRDRVHARRVVSLNLLAVRMMWRKPYSKYNLMALPVVDDEQRLLGIVTADDRWTRLSRPNGRSACRGCITRFAGDRARTSLAFSK